MFGSDKRADLSGVPVNLQGVAHANATPGKVREASPFWRMLRVAIVLCVAAAIGLAATFFLYSREQQATNAAVELPVAQVDEPQPEQADVQVREAMETYENAMRDADSASTLAQRQQAEAMKAVAAARALAKDPESREAQAAFDKAMKDVQALSERVSR